MPLQPTYPGVYVQEIPSGVRTIMGVSTSVAAFIDCFKRGPMNQAIQIFNFGDFERIFGGLDEMSEASFAIQQFFLNGGSQAWVVRVSGAGSNAADVTIAKDVTVGGADALKISAKNEGTWGNAIRVRIDHDTSAPATLFNLRISEYNSGGRAVRQEIFRELSVASAEAKVNDPNTGSLIIKIDESTAFPVANGTVSGQHGDPQKINITNANIVVDPPLIPQVKLTLDLKNGTSTNYEISLPEITVAGDQKISDLAVYLENGIRRATPTTPLLAGATVSVVDKKFVVKAGSGDGKAVITFDITTDDTTTVSELKLKGAGVVANLQEYILGYAASPITGTAQKLSTVGHDSATSPDSNAILGSEANKTGLYALENADDFNILCIPVASSGDDPFSSDYDLALSAATSYCEKRRAFFVIDTPVGISTVQGIKDWVAAKNLTSMNSAVYFPRVKIPNLLNGGQLRSVGASGTIAGLYARTDSTRGVWKAPAGIESSLRNVSALDYKLTDGENGVLNQLGINCLRNLPIYGSVCWGARTRQGADAMASEYKYVPVKRLALFLEESLFRGSQWVVFEPNDEKLWAQIRLNLGAFMNTLFRQGAFQGLSPRDAYLVKCDSETTTQTDINMGVVNILVGFAPLKPAEFVFINIQQLAGKIES